MSDNPRRLKFNLADLIVGNPLRFDIVSLDGRLLAAKDSLITPELMEQWAEQGIVTAVAVEPSNTQATDAPPSNSASPDAASPDAASPDAASPAAPSSRALRDETLRDKTPRDETSPPEQPAKQPISWEDTAVISSAELQAAKESQQRGSSDTGDQDNPESKTDTVQLDGGAVAGPAASAGDSASAAAPAEKDVLRPYDPAAMQRIERGLTQAIENVQDATLRLAQGDLNDCGALAKTIESWLPEVQEDVSAVVASIVGQGGELPTEHDAQLAARSARFSLLSVVVASQMERDDQECRAVGLAALLHDLSLYDQSTEAVKTIYGPQADERDRYRHHPLQSASILAWVGGISELARHLISQVHEQVDGSGFPRSMKRVSIHPLAYILNLTDAYLTLTLPEQSPRMPKASGLLPADGVAYLLHHVACGHFDSSAMRGLIAATSLYPVGSKVQLDDNSTATVLRSTPSAPAQPVVRVDGGAVIDLRGSHLRIESPVPSENAMGKRLVTTQLQEVLWKGRE